jgi:hypothetical protein
MNIVKRCKKCGPASLDNPSPCQLLCNRQIAEYERNCRKPRPKPRPRPGPTDLVEPLPWQTCEAMMKNYDKRFDSHGNVDPNWALDCVACCQEVVDFIKGIDPPTGSIIKPKTPGCFPATKILDNCIQGCADGNFGVGSIGMSGLTGIVRNLMP